MHLCRGFRQASVMRSRIKRADRYEDEAPGVRHCRKPLSSLLELRLMLAKPLEDRKSTTLFHAIMRMIETSVYSQKPESPLPPSAPPTKAKRGLLPLSRLARAESCKPLCHLNDASQVVKVPSSSVGWSCASLRAVLWCRFRLGGGGGFGSFRTWDIGYRRLSGAWPALATVGIFLREGL